MGTEEQAMESEQAPSPLASELLDQLAVLRDDATRRAWFARHPDLLDRLRVPELCRQVVALVRSDLDQATDLATTVRWVAAQLDDTGCRALAERATANVLHSAGATEEAQERYQRALELFDGIGDRMESAITRSSALLNLAYLGDYPAVYSWQEAARKVFEEEDDHLRLANLANNFGNILYRQDRWQEAQEHYGLAHRKFVELGKSRNAAICLRNLTVCHISLHHFAEALATYETARAACEQEGLRGSVLSLDYNIAYLFYLRGEYTRAIRRFQAARRAAESEGDAYHRALCDLDQTEIYLELNLVEEAARLAKSSHEGFSQLKMPYETAKALTNEAIAMGRMGEVASALDLLGRARRLFAQEGNRVWLALIDFYQAVVLYRGDRPHEAEELARGARRAFAESALAPRAAMSAVLLAQIYLRLGEPDRAREACHDAIERLVGLEMPALEHQAHLVLGQVEEAVGDPRAALEAYESAQLWLERLRSQVYGEDLKIAFLKDKHVVFESLVWLTMAKAPQPERDLQAFEYVEKSKSRSLADLMSFRAYALPTRVGERGELAGQVRQMREELNWFYRQIDHHQMEGRELRRGGAVERLRQETRSKEDELLRSQRELQTLDLEYSSLQSASAVDLEALRSSLGEGSALVEYFIARGKIFACVIDGERLEMIELTTAHRARRLHRFLQFQLSRSLPTAKATEMEREMGSEAIRSYLRELQRELVEPLLAHLDCHHLIIAPHGFLHYVPFHALWDGRQYLVERFSISYAPSAGVFQLCASKTIRPSNKSLVLGVADDRAPHILEEVRAVSESLPDATLLLGEEASEEALRHHAPGSRFVHIATHGLFRRDNPMFSAIQLGTTRLSLFDLYDLRLDAELVVLSGCGTGLNAVFGADELVGLTRGLLYAGTQCVLVTLWDVNDASTAAFMRRFYRHLGQGNQRAKALQLAMKDQRQEYPHPYHWAPFVLVGKPNGGGSMATKKGDRGGAG